MEKDIAGLEQSVDDIAECLRDAKKRGHPASLLMGAGCSKTGGIPLAQEIVDEVELTSPSSFARAKEKSYPHVMAALDSGRRYDLIARYVEHARLNWAHIMMGWLIRKGYLGRILTTNFDNLALRASALFAVYPSVYDLAAGGGFMPSLVRDPSIFFLHGQHCGFVQRHTSSEVDKHKHLVRPVLRDSTIKRPWLVVGYSGNNDPVFECLAEVQDFTFGLHWVTYDHETPAEHIVKRLLGKKRQAFFVRAKDADRFFIALVQKLGIGAPGFLADPFAHQLDLFSTFAPFPVDDATAETDIMREALALIERARSRLVTDTLDSQRQTGEAASILASFVAGDYDGIVAMIDGGEILPSEAVREVVAWALVRKADDLQRRAGRVSKRERESLFRQAVEFYKRAITCRPRMHEASSRLAVCLAQWASGKPDSAAQRLLARGEAEYVETIKVDGSIQNYDLLVDMACVAVSEGNADRCLELLHHRKLMKPTLTRRRLETETLLQPLACDPRFRAFLDLLPTSPPEESRP